MTEINSQRKMYDYVDLVVENEYNNCLEEKLLKEGFCKVIDNYFTKEGINIFCEEVLKQRNFPNMLNFFSYDKKETHIYVQSETEELGFQADNMLREKLNEDDKKFYAMRYLWNKRN